MLKRLHLRHFTVFEDADFAFGPGLNVIVGANGTGKTHVLKAGYAMSLAYYTAANIKASSFSSTDEHDAAVSIGFNVSSRLDEVFLPKGMSKLIHRQLSLSNALPARAYIDADFKQDDSNSSLGIYIASNATPANRLGMLKPAIIGAKTQNPVFIPAKEMLSLMPDIIGLVDKYSDLLDRTYTGLAKQLLIRPMKETPPVLNSLDRLLKGRIETDNGRFYLIPKEGEKFEINLVAEGHRKLGTLAYLLANGTLTPDTTLFWDEPEANLNPALLRDMAAVLAELARAGFQIILATHSLFLMKELHILAQREPMPIRYFGLSAENGGPTQVAIAEKLTALPNLVALDVEMAQSDIFLDVLNQEEDDNA